MSSRSKNILVVLLLMLNIGIAYAITVPFGIQNQILWQSSFTAMYYAITYEVIIWFILTFIEGLFIDRI